MNTRDMNLAIFVFPLAVILFFFGYKLNSKSGVIKSYVPVDTIKDIPTGIPVMVTGKVTSEQPLISPITQTPSVYYKYILEQQVEEKSQNGTTSLVWKTVGSPEDKRIPFQLQDASGIISVKPEQAQIEAPITNERFLNPGSIGSAQQTSFVQVASQLLSAAAHTQERVREFVLPLNAQINAFSIVTLEGNTPFLQNTSRFPLIITTKSKDQLVKSEQWKAYALYMGGVLALLVSIYFIIRPH